MLCNKTLKYYDRVRAESNLVMGNYVKDLLESGFIQRAVRVFEIIDEV